MTDVPQGPRINKTDLLAGIGMLALCGAFAAIAWVQYGVGRPARIGPGFFPFAFGIIGMGLAVAIIAQSFLWAGRTEAQIRWRPLLFVAGGVAAFGLLIELAGLLPTVFVSTIITGMADREARPTGTIVLAAVLTAGVWFMFIYLLGLPIQLLGSSR